MEPIDKATILSLGIGCPFGEQIDTCRLYLFRKLTHEEQVRLVNEMSSDEMGKIYECHLRCVALRERESLKEF